MKLSYEKVLYLHLRSSVKYANRIETTLNYCRNKKCLVNSIFIFARPFILQIMCNIIIKRQMQQNNWTNKYSISEIVPETGPFFVLKSQYLAIVIVVRSVQSQSEILFGVLRYCMYISPISWKSPLDGIMFRWLKHQASSIFW